MESPADRVMNLCERDGRPVQVMLDLERLKAERGRDGWWNPAPAKPLAFWRAASARCERSPTISGGSSVWGGLHALPALRASPGRRRRFSAGGQGRGEALRRFRGESDALVQGSGDGDDGLDGPGPGAEPTGGSDPGQCRRFARPSTPSRRGIEAVIVMSPDTDLPVLGKVAALRPAPSRKRQARARAGHDHRLRQAGAGGIRAAGLFQRGHVSGAGLAHRRKEDSGPGDGRAGRRSPRRAADGNCRT